MAIYRDLIIRFRGRLQEQLLDLDSSPVAVAADAREWLKGNEPMEPSVLPPKTSQVLYAYLSDERVYGNRLLTMPSDSPIWLSFSDRNFSQAIGPRTISNICERYLGTGKVHTTRHTAAVNLSHQKGLALEQVCQFLGHKNAKTTSEYRREKQSYENPYGDQMEADFGIEA